VPTAAERQRHSELARDLAIKLGCRVRELRRRRGFSTEALGAHAGLSGGWVRKVEQDAAAGDVPPMPGLNKLVGLLLAFGLSSLDELLGSPPGPTAEALDQKWARHPPDEI
jgi:transcriptional regulator with XRE-family HTH domain